MATHEIRIDRSKTLLEEPGTGSQPLAPGHSAGAALRAGRRGGAGDAGRVRRPDGPGRHPGRPWPRRTWTWCTRSPVRCYVEGAEPGDLLEVEILDVEPDRYGYTVQVPGFGFLRDEFPEPFKVNWDIADGWATSADLPGVRIPGAPFMGTIGLAPGHELLAETAAREQACSTAAASCCRRRRRPRVPADPRIAAEALRTIPPREQGGNMDIKQLGKGARLLIPVDTPGALFSAGDAHFAQGDCETCGTAIEMSATLRVRFGCARARRPRRASATCSSPARTTTCRRSSRRRDGSTPPRASR